MYARLIAAALWVSVAFGVADASAAEPGPVRHFDASRFSQQVTDCDERAAHPDDPNKVSRGKEHAEIDLPAAVAACREALKRDSQNPRIRYQLARVLAYSGHGEESLPLIQQSADEHYPQALFVTGYLYLEGLYSAPKDLCRAAQLIHESALYGRRAGLLGYPAYVLEGRFKGCSTKQDVDEMRGFLEQAKAAKPDYYQSLLIDALARELGRLRPAAAARAATP